MKSNYYKADVVIFVVLHYLLKLILVVWNCGNGDTWKLAHCFRSFCCLFWSCCRWRNNGFFSSTVSWWYNGTTENERHFAVSIMAIELLQIAKLALVAKLFLDSLLRTINVDDLVEDWSDLVRMLVAVDNSGSVPSSQWKFFQLAIWKDWSFKLLLEKHWRNLPRMTAIWPHKQ